MVRPLIGFLLIMMSIDLSAQVTNQNLYDTFPTMREHYEQRLAAFRKETVEKGKIIFLGNSITEGGKDNGLTDGRERINRGIGGDVTFGILNRLDEVISRKPSRLFILIGINDIGKDFPESVILDNYKKIVQRVKTDLPSVKVYIQSLLPVNPQVQSFPQHYDKGDHVVSLNKKLKVLAKQESVYFINLYPLFADNQGDLDVKLTYDGLHLNSEGYKVWLSCLTENGYIDKDQK